MHIAYACDAIYDCSHTSTRVSKLNNTSEVRRFRKRGAAIRVGAALYIALHQPGTFAETDYSGLLESLLVDSYVMVRCPQGYPRWMNFSDLHSCRFVLGLGSADGMLRNVSVDRGCG